MRQDVTKEELDGRLAAFRREMDRRNPDWDTAFFLGRVNQYYFTGTMQDGLLVIKKGGGAFYFIRRSYERARDESPFAGIFPMRSYRDAAAAAGAQCGHTYMDTEVATLGIVERMRRHFRMEPIRPLEAAVMAVRSVKSPFELDRMIRSGKLHREFLEEIVPPMLREGMNEADFVAGLFERMVRHGYQGISRFSMFQTEMVVGQVGFAESSLYPTSFDGPGGAYGMCPAVPLVGSREKRLRRGDLVFVDIAFGVGGYHTDRTQVYQFGGRPSEDVVRAHRACMDVQKRLAEALKPGAVPGGLYRDAMDRLSGDFRRNFMGFAGRQAKFLGHGIGLQVDEMPVIADGFDEPLRENMALALEPKKGMPRVGTVGVEDTYIVTPEGGRCITGGGRDILVV